MPEPYPKKDSCHEAQNDKCDGCHECGASAQHITDGCPNCEDCQSMQGDDHRVMAAGVTA